ncbi:MAG: oligosaccharide flippase family protein [Patescibacteria group bacterium]
MSTLKEIYRKIIGYGTELLGLDLRYFASGGFWTALGQGINGVISFLLVIAFANLLPKETYGLYRYILSLAGIFNVFTMTGMNTAVSQAVAAGNEGALRASVRYQLKWNIIMAIALWSFGGYYFVNNNPALAISFFIFGAFAPLISAFNTYGAYLDGKKQFKINNLFSIFSTVIYATGMILAMLLSSDILPLIIAYALTTLISNLFFYWNTLRIFQPPLAPAGDVLRYGRQLTFLGFIGPIVAQADSIILAHFWGPAQLAVYSLARAIPDKVGPLVKNIINLGLPKLAVKNAEEIDKVFYKRVFQTLGLGALLAAGYILLSPLVFKYLLPKYIDSIFYSQILALSFIFIAPVGYIGTAINSQKMILAIVSSSVSSSIVKIILYIVLGIWGGILGLVLAQVIYYIIVFFINIILWKFKTPPISGVCKTTEY